MGSIPSVTFSSGLPLAGVMARVIDCAFHLLHPRQPSIYDPRGRGGSTVVAGKTRE
jgi:orotate phosphoribosyltransferase-like protein